MSEQVVGKRFNKPEIIQNFTKIDENFLDTDALNNMLEHIKAEKRRAVRDYYMDMLTNRLFLTSVWSDKENLVTQSCITGLMSKSDKDLSVKVLKTFAAACRDMRYTPNCVDLPDIISLIVKYGGKNSVSVKSIPDTKQLRAKKVILRKLINIKTK